MTKKFYTKVLIFTILGFFCATVPCLSNTETVQTGVASPRDESERNNIEKLRDRAIRNALDLAVLHVSGATISGERGDSLRSKEDTTISDDRVEESIQQQSRFRSAATSRSDGHAQLIEIIREWQTDGQYYVEARIYVLNREESESAKNAGYYWRQAGQPVIHIRFTEEFNGDSSETRQNRTLSYLRDNLVSNDVTIAEDNNTIGEYRIDVLQSLHASDMAGLGTITMNCRLSYQIVDMERDVSVTEYRAAHGPQAGFSLEQAQENCLKAIAPDVSDSLTRSLGGIMIDRWNNGIKYQIVINGVPGEYVPLVGEILQNLYQVTSAEPEEYRNGTFMRRVQYKGGSSDLANAVQNAFADEDWQVKIGSVGRGKISLQWITNK